MAFTSFNQTSLSDLVQNEISPSVGYARQDINVTPPAAGAAVAMGTVVFRAKDAANTEATAYTVLSASTDIVATNEFAIVFGDHYKSQESFVPRAIAANQFNAVAFVGRGTGVILKEKLVKAIAQDANGADLTDAEFEQLREILKGQGIILETTI